MIFIVFLFSAGCGGSPTAPPIEGNFIHILSVTPNSGLIDGLDTNFKVVVEYNLFSYATGELYIAFGVRFDTDAGHLVVTNATHSINKGYGTHEFNVTVKPKDWGSEGDFSVLVCIDEVPEFDYILLDCDGEILTFKQ